MLLIELALIVVGWVLVAVAVRFQLGRVQGVRLRGRSTEAPFSWPFLVLLIIGLSCCEVGAQLGKHGQLRGWGFVIAYVPVLVLVMVAASVHNRRLRSADR